ncbi:MAG TPA: alpha/beta hydrolase [Ruminococcaceae bacterium]|nr:alpha/beta hydrolase [Oscillospiraceae bacterium]
MKKTTTAVLGTTALLGTAFIASGEVLYRMFLTSKAVRESKLLHENNWLNEMMSNTPITAQGMLWLKSAARRDHTILGRRKKWIHADEYPSENSHIWVIVCHGYSVKPESNAAQIRHFVTQGWNVLAPSLTGHGISEDKAASMGWFDRLDLCDWIAYIGKNDPDAQIVLYGVSMGAATVMMTTGEVLPQNVKCCVADCGYTSVYDEFKTQIKQWLHLPAFPFLYAGDFVTRLHAGYSFKQASAVNQLKQSHTPTLFIHGEDDTFVPFAMQEECFQACACEEKEKISFAGAGHALSGLVAPEEYTQAVTDFICRYLDRETPQAK